jgi:hypothetical protein
MSPDLLCEPGRPASAWPYSERHVQGVWFDSRYRPNPLTTEQGESLWVDDPGIWNQEAGPDFLGAVVRVGPDRRRLRGDVEVHVHPAGWNQHRHQADPRYQDVRIHVTWFPGVLPEQALPPGTIQVSLYRALKTDPCFSLDAVDTTSYPYAARAEAPPCYAVLRDWHPDRKEALLDAAGRERMRRKAERMRLRVTDVGTDQALYEDVLAALGYKHNKGAFRALAGRIPIAELRAVSDGDPLAAYAILAGVASLLPAHPAPAWDPETRAFFRTLWNTWWKFRSRFAERILPGSEWRLAGIRPANHPRRRLMAAARLFSSPRPWAHTLPDMATSLASLRDPYWDTRLSLGGRKQDSPIALLGKTRIDAILLNVFVPFLTARNAPVDFAGLPRHLPVEEENEIIRRTAHYLFGPDHPPSLYRTGLRRQGLIQIFQDFCLNDRSRCGTCPLPGALREDGAVVDDR